MCQARKETEDKNHKPLKGKKKLAIVCLTHSSQTSNMVSNVILTHSARALRWYPPSRANKDGTLNSLHTFRILLTMLLTPSVLTFR
jgi:hypothetical protein